MFKSNYERKMRYSIRKFSVGVASVAVASLFMGSVVHASELVKDDSVKTTEVAAKPYPSMAQTDQGNNSSSSERETTKMEIPTIDIKKDVEPVEKTAITASQNDEKRKSTENVTAEKTKGIDSSKSNANKANENNQPKIELTVSQDNITVYEGEDVTFTVTAKSDSKTTLDFTDLLTKYNLSVSNRINTKYKTDADNHKIAEITIKSLKQNESKTVTLKATDASGNVVEKTFTITVKKKEEKQEQLGASNQENPGSVPPITLDKKENDVKSGWEGIIDGSGKLLSGFSKIKEKLEKEIDESSLTLEQKKSYEEKIAKVAENDVEGLFDVRREYLNQLDFQYPELSKVEEELKYQEEQIQRMFEQKGITNEDKDAMLKKIEEIRQEAQKDIKASEGNRDKLSVAKVKFLQNLDKLFTSTKSKFEKEMQELYRKKEEEIVKDKHLEKDKIYDDADVQKLRELEKDALKKLDEAKTNDEALRVKLEFARNVEKNSYKVQKAKVDDKLQELLKEAKRELEKLNREVAEVDKLPKLPDNDPDYEIQKKYFWESQKEILDKKIEAFNKSLTEHAYTERSVKLFISDCIYYQNFAKIEAITRQVAEYRKKYPNNSEIKKIFDTEMKQTTQDNYGSLENDSLTNYFDKHFRSPFDQIKKIVEELEKKSNQEVPQKQDKVAEAQKKVEEAEKKAKVQEEEDHHNYPTNTRKTIELEIAEAQVEVAKAELELAEAESQTPQDTDRVNTAKAKVETAKREVETLEKIKSGHGRPQAGAQKPSRPAPDTKPNHQSQPEGKQPSTPKEPDNKKPSVPTQEKPIPQPVPPKPEAKPTPETPEVKPVPQPETPKTSKIFTAYDGKTKVTVVFDKAVDADKVNIKEVTTKELADKIARKTGGGTVRVFDLSLSKGGKETHVNGERTVRIALGQTGSDVHVYHVKENGDLERIPSKVENGQVVFKTSHFSLFAIKTLSKNKNVTAPKQTKPSIQGDQVQVAESQNGKFQNKEVNPKPLATGNETMAKGNYTSATEKKLPSTGVASNLVLEFIGLLGLAGTSLIAMKRRK